MHIPRIDITVQKYGKLTVLETMSKYKNNTTYCKCLCECGKEKIAIKHNIVRGATKSCGCGEIESRYQRKHYIDITGRKFNMLTAIRPSEKKSSNGSMYWICCCDCGNYTECTYSNLKRFKNTSCGCNKRSNKEVYIEYLLDQYRLHFEREKSFKDCKYINELRFDFYLPHINTVIEYDGEQHFKTFEYFGGNDTLRIIKIRDNIKNEYCTKKNIRIIRIPYNYSNHRIEQIIQTL